MAERSWLYTCSWAGTFAYPVDVLSRGKKYARVRLLHQTLIGRVRYPRGTIKHRVPLGALREQPIGGFVSLGGGRFKPR